ncbi:MAG: H-NS histone family protein [Limimaricola soesokkakensis]|uniref:DNA binding protein, nucleoid-associated n=1 Tax=Limimaricola soesokkakensis TaxID=1343159 RepID=A0A1X6ZKB6_9RHOB|nr:MULTISPECIES: H-NS histone family protein [Limimaricola]MCZ4261731.1 H-NS histone family protein [Limimaricola sp. G21655-S1]PSK84937.1 DNA-binding protein H-NS [Limimaricola soesokkakensis]SLN53386.1 DNA binding protein, nucleoid-associated [Limimaricola soesokkakensis]
MAHNLHEMSRKELEKLRKDIDEALSTVSQRERKAALEAAERAAAEHGFSLAELADAAGKGRKSKTKNPAKYRNPEDPTQTWSGRGRKPRWINEAEAAGRPLSDFEI